MITGSGPDQPPEPPDDLPLRPLPVTEISEPLYRGHRKHRQPVYFNASNGRFAPPDGESYGVMYVGLTAACSFIEMFDFDADPGFGISAEVVAQSCLCVVTVRRRLRVVDLTAGPSLKRLSPRADNRLSDGSHAVSQRWAAAFWAHPDAVDGILYRARNAPELSAVALFDRVAEDLAADCTTNLFHDSRALADLLDYFDCPLLP